MSLKIITLSSVICLIAGAGLAALYAAPAQSSTHSKSKTAQHHYHHAGYVKPGAAVTLTHDYDGDTAPGEFETVTLTLNHLYVDGYLSVEILPTPKLQIFSNYDLQKLDLQTGSTLNLPVQFSGTEAGHYSIAIETVYESQNGQQSRRVLSLPILIGRQPASKTQPAASKSSKPALKGVIALPVNEVIR